MKAFSVSDVESFGRKIFIVNEFEFRNFYPASSGRHIVIVLHLAEISRIINVPELYQPLTFIIFHQAFWTAPTGISAIEV